MSIAWHLADELSRFLDPDEADAVCGDLRESGKSGVKAFWELLGLLARRYAEAWAHWGPWVAPLGMAAPMLLLLGGRRLGEPWLGYLSLQFNGLWNYRARISLGLPVVDDTLRFVALSLLMAAWCWIGGFTFGALARRLSWVLSPT